MPVKKGRGSRKQSHSSAPKRNPVKPKKPKPGPKPAPSPGGPGAPIAKGSFENVVIILKENHTLDCYFGTFPGVNGVSNLAQASDPPFATGVRLRTAHRRGDYFVAERRVSEASNSAEKIESWSGMMKR